MISHRAGYGTAVGGRQAQRGMVLIMSLLLLVVVTLLAVAMFRGMGIYAKIAGNVREKQRALHSAVSAEQYAEFWLSSGSNAAAVPTNCDVSNTGVSANLSATIVQICSNIPYGPSNPTQDATHFDPTKVPWQISGQNVGFFYSPVGLNVGVAQSGSGVNYANYYVAPPAFYISYLGGSADPANPGNVFQIDAYGYGGTPDSVAVIESTYLVSSGVKNLGGP